MEHSIASAADFKSAMEQDRRAERVVLPRLGKPVLMRRPPPLWFIFRGQLPQTLAVGAASSAPTTAAALPTSSNRAPAVQTAEDAERVARWLGELLAEVMVEPHVSLSPGPGEIAPEMIAGEDLNFIVRWAVGEVASEELAGSAARDLTAFRGQ